MKTRLIIFVIVSLSLYLFLPQSAQTQEEASVSGEPVTEIIKENVKQRIKDIVKGESIDLTRPTAVTGKLLSISNVTLTIDSKTGSKMASISGETTFARLPESVKLTLDDISIDDYLIALGYLNDSDILDTKRVLVQKTIPQPSPKRTFFGVIDSFDADTKIMRISHPGKDEVKEFSLTKKSQASVLIDLDQTIPFDPKDNLEPNSYALVVYSPTEANLQIADKLLIKTYPTATTDQNPPPQAESITPTLANQIPPELR